MLSSVVAVSFLFAPISLAYCVTVGSVRILTASVAPRALK